MAWAMTYMDFWKDTAKDFIDVIEKIMEECMAGLIPNAEQDRWIKGLATVVLADTLVNNISLILNKFIFLLAINTYLHFSHRRCAYQLERMA
jgi:hypothetical protein